MSSPSRLGLALLALLFAAAASAQSSNTFIPGAPYTATPPVLDGQCLAWSVTLNKYTNVACSSGGSSVTPSSVTTFSNKTMIAPVIDQEVFVACGGVSDSAAISAATGTGKNVHLAGICLITQPINLGPNQCLRGDGDHVTFVDVNSTFSTSATGVIVLTGGAESASPCVHDLNVSGAQPQQVNLVSASTVASANNQITVNSIAGTAQGYYIFDSTALAVVFTGAISSSATSATLAGNWAYPTNPYTVTFSDGESRSVTLTNGATTATWSGGLSASVTANAVASNAATPAFTTITNISGSGPYTLTLSNNLIGVGVTTGDTIGTAPARSNAAALGTCTGVNGGSICQYPPFILDVTANRPRFWNLALYGAWDGIVTANTVAETFTAGISSGATSATLTGNWTLATGSYTIQWSDTETTQVSFINGAATATWTIPLVNNVTANATLIRQTNIVPAMTNIEVGALDIGWRADGAQDSARIMSFHDWQFGWSNIHSFSAYADGQTIGVQIGRMDGLIINQMLFENARFVITPDANNSVAPSQITALQLDSFNSNLEIGGGINNIFTNMEKGAQVSNGSTTCPITVTSGTTEIYDAWIQVANPDTTNAVCVSGGRLFVKKSYMYAGTGNFSDFSQTGGTLDLEGNYFGVPTTLVNPFISSTGGSSITVVKGNTVANTGTGTAVSIGTFVTGDQVTSDNNFQGYTYSLPATNTNAFQVTSSGGSFMYGPTFAGPLIQAEAGEITMTNAGSVTPSGNASSVHMHGAATITSYTINLGTGSSGLVYNFYFDAAVNALTWGGGTNIGAPSFVQANSWVICQYSNGAAEWLCSTATTPQLSAGLVLSQSGLPLILTPSGFMDATGNVIIGQTPTATATATFSATSGAGVTMTLSSADLLGTAADVGRVLTILDTTYKYATITTQLTTSTATVTLTGTLSGVGPFANNAIWLSGSTASNAAAYSVPLPSAYPASYAYFPASSPIGTLGLYYCTWSATTLGVCFNNKYTSGNPTIPGSTTAFSGLTAAAYTQTTGSNITMPTVTMPANSLGVSGRMECMQSWNASTSSATKTIGLNYGASTVKSSTITTVGGQDHIYVMKNAGSITSQVSYDMLPNSFGSYARTAVNSGAAQNVAMFGQLNTVSTDFLVLEDFSCKVFPN